MKYYHLGIFWIVLLSGCGLVQKPLSIDESLPKIQKIQTLSDVSSVAFEWENKDKLEDGSPTAIEGFVIFRADQETLQQDSQAPQNLTLESFKRIATIKNPLATHFFDTNLKPKSTYYYLFATLGKDSTMSAYSQAIKVQTSFIDPVEGVFAISSRPRTIKLIITPHPNPSIKSYIIQRKDSEGRFESLKELKHRLNIEYFDSNLQDSTTYVYRVLAKDFEGNISEPSEEVSARTLDLIECVEGVSATTQLPLKIGLAWQPHPKATSYRIYADIESNGRYKLIATTQNTSYTHTLKEHGQSVAYQIVGVDMYGFDGEQLQTPIAGATLSRPIAPNITSSQIQGNTIAITWDTPNDGRAVKYALYRKDSQTNRNNRYNNIKTTHFIDKETKHGIDYTYSVVSIDEFGIESPQSPSVTLQR
ncbi:fibronectin type III domain-containing protein [uncultured Helicobacter sp.]|uniref:fibronectin type III domain-containing protein n=1 Tax=uncultured Helicobacter sp. TaxID=175537 RepID=UPI00374E8E1E